jgi:hypothetical protein
VSALLTGMADLAQNTNQSLSDTIGIFLSSFSNPFEAYASAETSSSTMTPPKQQGSFSPDATLSSRDQVGGRGGGAPDGKDHAVTAQIDCGGETKGTLSVSYVTDNGRPGIRFAYNGAHADRLRMHQYVWRELHGRRDGHGDLAPISGIADPEGETAYCLTTHDDRKYIHYDVTYDGRAHRSIEYTACRTATDSSSKICEDFPTGKFPNDWMEYNSLESTAHFETFFTVDNKACARVAWVRKNVWIRPEQQFQWSLERARNAASAGSLKIEGQISVDEGNTLRWSRFKDESSGTSMYRIPGSDRVPSPGAGQGMNLKCE